MWGYCVLSCLTAFDVAPGSTAVAFILTQKYCDVMGLCWVIHQKKVPLGTPDTVAPVFKPGDKEGVCNCESAVGTNHCKIKPDCRSCLRHFQMGCRF